MKYIINITACFVLLIASCNKNGSSKCKYFNMPSTLIFKIMKDGVIVPDSILSKAQLAYFENGKKKYLTDFTLSLDTMNQHKGLIGTRAIGLKSGDFNVKTYFIEYPNKWPADTLYIDYPTPSPATSCLYILQTIKYNGQQVEKDSNIVSGMSVFLLNKQ